MTNNYPNSNLTVIIPFLNERTEIENTLHSIRSTAGENVEILIINDCSTDKFDYEEVALRYNASYHKNEERLGVAASRDLGVSLIKTDYFLILDGHMRFFQKDWISILTKELANHPRALLCCQTKSLLMDEKGTIIIKSDRKDSYGAYIHIDEASGLGPKWNWCDLHPDKTVVEIACVLGAAYATSKKYWQYLKGLEGLRSYGCDEELISIKVWMEGGKCLLLKNIPVGHIYRNKAPYEHKEVDFMYNKLYIAELFFTKEDKYMVFDYLNKKNPSVYIKAMQLLVSNRNAILSQKEYSKKISTRDITSVMEQNKFLKIRNV